jgi:NADPH:quinone reductase-like Zn-dependent oxidoreductase
MTSLGADHTVDYTKVDALKGGDKYDVILAANGDRSASEFKAALSEGGYCIVSGGTNSQTSSAMLAGITSGKKQITNLMMKFNPVDLKQLQELYEAGKIKSVIDKTYTLDEVPQAIAHVESGVRGKLAIQVVA